MSKRKRKRPNRAAAILALGALLGTTNAPPTNPNIAPANTNQAAISARPNTPAPESGTSTSGGRQANNNSPMEGGRHRRRRTQRFSVRRQVKKRLERDGVVTSGRQMRKLLKAYHRAQRDLAA